MSADLVFFRGLALVAALALLRVARLLDMQRKLDHVVAKNESKSSCRAVPLHLEPFDGSHTNVLLWQNLRLVRSNQYGSDSITRDLLTFCTSHFRLALAGRAEHDRDRTLQIHLVA
jgi:hypothetical protein